MRLLHALLLPSLYVQLAYASQNAFVIGQAAEYSAGPYGFHASPISFAGRKLGYASANYKPQRLSDGNWVYLSCVITQKDPAFDGECMQWKILDVRTHKVVDLKLPAFDSYWSVPGFDWPYVAYVGVGKLTPQGPQAVYCILFDYQKKLVIRRQKHLVSEDTFSTDFPRIFTAPVLRKENGITSFAFSYDDSGKNKVICELPVP